MIFTKTKRKELSKGLFIAFINRNKFDEVMDRNIENAIRCLEFGTNFDSEDHYLEVLGKVKDYLGIKDE